MKSLFVITTALALIGTAAYAGDFKVEYDQSATTASKAAKSTAVKTEFTNKLVGPLNYSVETVVAQDNGKGNVTSQLVGKVGTAIPVGFITVKPRVEYGASDVLGKATAFYGAEAMVTTKTPVKGLTASVGYRQRINAAGYGNKVSREEVAVEYAVLKNYGVGIEGYRNNGNVSSNVVGAFVRAKF